MQVDILFALFALEEEEGGGLAYGELLDAMQKREGYKVQPKQQSRGVTAMPDMEALFGCLRGCFRE
jgi:hypothetical protein